MAFTVTWDGNDITHKVINYTRDHSLCSSTGTLTVEVAGYDSYTTWDELIIIENSVKKATYNISTVTKNYKGTTTLTGENGAKRTGDYFVHTYYNPGWVSNAKYWIEKFLTEAGVSYSFNVAGNGAVIDENSAFGRDTVYNLIIPFLQHSGWYITYDENNDAEIGTLDKDLSNYVATFTRDEILSVALRKNDKMSRNKAIVWGGRDFLRDQLISAVVYEEQDWQTSSSDVRPIILSNSAIKNYSTAYGIAWKLVNEFSTLTKIKEVKVAGFHNVKEGDVVFVKSDIYTGTGMVTSLTTTVSNSGEITTLVLDERCPRLFAYWAWDGYVYIGTWGSGVWKKPLEVNSWSSYNTGLGNLFIKDLYIQNGVFVCVANDGYAYYNYITDNYWKKIEQGTLTDINEIEFEEADVEAVACTIDDDNNIIVGYNSIISDTSWVLHYKPLVGITRTEQVIADGTNDVLEIYDLDNTGERTIIGVAGVNPEDDVKGKFPSAFIPTDGDMNFGKVAWGGNDIGYGRFHNHRQHFHNADYFLDHPDLIHQDYNPRSRVGTYPPYYGSILEYGPYHYYGTLTSTLGSLPYKGAFSKVKSHDGSGVAGVTFTPWDTSNVLAISQGAHRRYALYDEDTIIACHGHDIYKVDFSTGSFSSIGTLPSPAAFCDTSFPIWAGPYIEAMWGGNGNPIVIFYYYSIISKYSVDSQVFNQYHTSVYDGSFTNNGEFGAYSLDYPICVDGDVAAYHGCPAMGNLSLSTATVAIFSSAYDDYLLETSPEPTQLGNYFSSYNISLSTGVASAGGGLELKNDWNFSHSAGDNQVFPSSRKMIVSDGIDEYYYTITAGGISSSTGEYTGGYAGNDFVKWGGGLANVNMTTGELTVIDGSFPLSTLTHRPDNIAVNASDTDGTIVYWNDTIASGIVIENGTDIVYIQPQAWSPPGNPTILDSINLVGNRIFTGAEIITISGYLNITDDAPVYSGPTSSGGYVLRDNYLLGDTIPSGYAGFTTVLSGIIGGPHIELSKTAPTIVHTESSGIVPSYMWSSYTNASGSFTPIDAGNRRIVNDVRVYTDFNENIPQSGGFRVGIASPSGFMKNMPDLSEEFTPAFSGIAVSGEVLKLETTNYDTPPFFFLVTGSGAGQKFYQRNPSSSSFFENSSGLPASGIRIIRTDDGM